MPKGIDVCREDSQLIYSVLLKELNQVKILMVERRRALCHNSSVFLSKQQATV